MDSDSYSSSDEEDACPLCLEPLDLTEKNFKPCHCGYQLCRFCWHRLKEDGNALCPACRTPYSQENYEFTPPNPEEIAKMKKGKKEKKDKEKQKKQKKEIESRKQLSDVRVVQRNLVYITNIPLSFFSLAEQLPTSTVPGASGLMSPPPPVNVTSESSVQLLRKNEYFGQYGKIVKLVVNRNTLYNASSPQGPTVSCYVTYAKKEEAAACIQATNGAWLDGKLLRASYGTTKYCTFFLRGVACTNPECLYLHEPGVDKDSFTKESMAAGKNLFSDQVVPRISYSNRTKNVLPPVGLRYRTPPIPYERAVQAAPPGPKTTEGMDVQYSPPNIITLFPLNGAVLPPLSASSEFTSTSPNPLSLSASGLAAASLSGAAAATVVTAAPAPTPPAAALPTTASWGAAHSSLKTSRSLSPPTATLPAPTSAPQPKPATSPPTGIPQLAQPSQPVPHRQQRALLRASTGSSMMSPSPSPPPEEVKESAQSQEENPPLPISAPVGTKQMTHKERKAAERAEREKLTKSATLPPPPVAPVGIAEETYVAEVAVPDKHTPQPNTSNKTSKKDMPAPATTQAVPQSTPPSTAASVTATTIAADEGASIISGALDPEVLPLHLQPMMEYLLSATGAASPSANKAAEANPAVSAQPAQTLPTSAKKLTSKERKALRQQQKSASSTSPVPDPTPSPKPEPPAPVKQEVEVVPVPQPESIAPAPKPAGEFDPWAKSAFNLVNMLLEEDHAAPASTAAPQAPAIQGLFGNSQGHSKFGFAQDRAEEVQPISQPLPIHMMHHLDQTAGSASSLLSQANAVHNPAVFTGAVEEMQKVVSPPQQQIPPIGTGQFGPISSMFGLGSQAGQQTQVGPEPREDQRRFFRELLPNINISFGDYGAGGLAQQPQQQTSPKQLQPEMPFLGGQHHLQQQPLPAMPQQQAPQGQQLSWQPWQSQPMMPFMGMMFPPPYRPPGLMPGYSPYEQAAPPYNPFGFPFGVPPQQPAASAFQQNPFFQQAGGIPKQQAQIPQAPPPVSQPVLRDEFAALFPGLGLHQFAQPESFQSTQPLTSADPSKVTFLSAAALEKSLEESTTAQSLPIQEPSFPSAIGALPSLATGGESKKSANSAQRTPGVSIKESQAEAPPSVASKPTPAEKTPPPALVKDDSSEFTVPAPQTQQQATGKGKKKNLSVQVRPAGWNGVEEVALPGDQTVSPVSTKEPEAPAPAATKKKNEKPAGKKGRTLTVEEPEFSSAPVAPPKQTVAPAPSPPPQAPSPSVGKQTGKQQSSPTAQPPTQPLSKKERKKRAAAEAAEAEKKQQQLLQQQQQQQQQQQAGTPAVSAAPPAAAQTTSSVPSTTPSFEHPLPLPSSLLADLVGGNHSAEALFDEVATSREISMDMDLAEMASVASCLYAIANSVPDSIHNLTDLIHAHRLAASAAASASPLGGQKYAPPGTAPMPSSSASNPSKTSYLLQKAIAHVVADVDDEDDEYGDLDYDPRFEDPGVFSDLAGTDAGAATMPSQLVTRRALRSLMDDASRLRPEMKDLLFDLTGSFTTQASSEQQQPQKGGSAPSVQGGGVPSTVGMAAAPSASTLVPPTLGTTNEVETLEKEVAVARKEVKALENRLKEVTLRNSRLGLTVNPLDFQ